MSGWRIRTLLTLALVCCGLAPAAGAWAATSGPGSQLWTATYGAGTPAFAYAVAVSPDGSTVFSAGQTNYGTSAPSHDAVVAVNTATGQVKWSATYRSSSMSGQRDRALALAVSPDGSKVFVASEATCPSNCATAFNGYSTIAYDAATGRQLWVSSYAEDGPGAYSIAVSPDGSKVFVNGGTASNGDATVAYDATAGQQLFVIQNAGVYAASDALAVSPDGSTVFVASMLEPGHPPCGFQVGAYDASDGSPRWSALYPDCNWDDHVAIALSPDGSTLYAAGSGNTGTAVVAYGANSGTQLWAAPDDQIRLVGDDQLALAVSPDGGRVFLAGSYDCTSSCSEQPVSTAAYDSSTGNQLWSSTYDSAARNWVNSVAVSPNGSQVFVAVQEQMPCYPPCTSTQVNAPLVAYEADSGAESWVADYQSNTAWDLATSPDGSNIYVGGTFTTAVAASAPPSSQRACSSGACGFAVTAYGTHAGPGIAQDRDPAPDYNGWSTFFDRTASGGTYRASRFTGHPLTFTTPPATTFTWIAHLGRQEGRARVWIDGRPSGTFDLYAAAASSHSYVFSGLVRRAHRVTIQVLGTKDAASRGRWVTFDAFSARRAVRQDSSLTVSYGTWRGLYNTAAGGASCRESASPRDSVSLTFRGRRIDWLTAMGPAYGRAEVVIDGVHHVVDLYRPVHAWRVRVAFAGLSAGTHHLTLRPLGARDEASNSKNIVFDAFVIH